LTCQPKEFQSKLGITLEGDPTQWFGAVTYTAGDGVDTMQIGGKTYSGVKLRSLLGLRSTVFTVTATKDCVRISTQGFGHRVGMSQYGADAMAVTGSTYDQILSHYYPGTALTKL
jgi:stage II sporulation protein D